MPVASWLEPTSLDQACDLLADDEFESTALAGGTAVSLMLKMGFLDPERLVSLARLPGLDQIDVGDDHVDIGAAVSLSQVAQHATLRACLPSLATACASVGNVRVRNIATLGGNLAEADYASDPPAVLVSLGAVCVIRGPSGERRAGVEDVVVGHYTTSLEPGELITSVRIPTPPGRSATYLKYLTRSSEDRPCIGVAARVDRAEARPDASVTGLDVVVGAVAGTPQRVAEATEAEVGRPLDRAAADRLATAYAEAIDPIDDARGSSWYRTQMIEVFVRRAVIELSDGPGRGGTA